MAILIDELTGDIIAENIVRYQTKEQRENYTKKRYKDINAKYEDMGNFVFIYRHKFEEISSYLDSATLLRLMYLVTFMNYNNELVYKNGKKISKDSILDVLKLKKRSFADFKKKVGDLIMINDDNITVSKELAIKGKLKKKDRKLVVRLYKDSMDMLYNGCDVKQQKTLGYILKLMPYLNYKYNIICRKEDVNKDEMKDIEPLKFSEICEVLGYNKANSARLKKDLQEFTCEDKPVISFLKSNDISKAFVFVSPYVFYSGDFNEIVQMLAKQFA